MVAPNRHLNLSTSRATGKATTIFPPTVTSVAANNGPAAGGTAVTITGTNFRKSANPGVTFGATPATAVVVTSKTTITCITPAHGAGAVDVHVNNAAGGDGHNMIGTGAGAFTFT